MPDKVDKKIKTKTGKSRTIYKSARGARYYLKNGKKCYVKKSTGGKSSKSAGGRKKKSSSKVRLRAQHGNPYAPRIGGKQRKSSGLPTRARQKKDQYFYIGKIKTKKSKKPAQPKRKQKGGNDGDDEKSESLESLG